jgi:hypothetical protein
LIHDRLAQNNFKSDCLSQWRSLQRLFDLVEPTAGKMGKMDRRDAAKEREVSAKETTKNKAAKDQEDAYWAAAGEGEKGKGGKKKEEEEKKKTEAAAKKLEAKKLLEEEERAMAKKAAKPTIAGVQKVGAGVAG